MKASITLDDHVDSGVYDVKITQIILKFSTGRGDPYLQFSLRIVSDRKFKGQIIYRNISLQSKSRWFLSELLQAADPDFNLHNGDLDLSKFLGRRLQVTIQNDRPSDGVGNKYPHFLVAEPLLDAAVGSVDSNGRQ